MKKLFLAIAIAMLPHSLQAGDSQLTGNITAGPPSVNDGESLRRVAQSITAVGVSIRTLYADSQLLVDDWEKVYNQLLWWNKCGKSTDCLDWVKLGIPPK